jgi:hypothetical protein
MRSTWFIRAARSVAAVALLAATVGASVASAKPAPDRGAKRRGANLFALVFGVMNVNRIYCGINNIGELCVDPTNSPVVGGGFWPKGTPDQYVFNSGLQLAGTIPSTAGFAWAGDTIGAFFMDPRGDQAEGDPITLVYNSLDPGDLANWPNGATVRDAVLYAPVLLGRTTISQEDLWVRTWDGNPALLSGRTHPMGVLVEERGMAWNFPTGNEDIVYFVFSFTNVTASNPAVYNNPTINPAIQSEVAAIGADFQARNEARFNIQIPDNGFAFTNLFAAFFADMDVGDAGLNHSTATIPFSMGIAYKSNFLEKSWTFPADIFGPPFVASPGFIGVKYLRSPTNALGQQIGLTIFSSTRNAATGYPDPVGVKQLYRYLSGTSSPAAGDQPCTFQGQQLALHFCFADQLAADTRFFQSSGPFTLNPGEAKTIVVAYINAAPTPAVTPFVNGDLLPGIPATGAQINTDSTKIRTIERAMGWITQRDSGPGLEYGDGIIEQDEVRAVPRSLLNKGLVAQAVYDNKFLLPFSPDPPTFFLIPGDNQVTIAWQKSGTETIKAGGGDPFFQIASDPTSQLYDPNFFQYDVEGYRIYRGRSTSALQLVAQFDYAGTVRPDYTGQFDYETDTNGNGKLECAPELGIVADCPVVFNGTNHSDHDLTGDVVQVPAGGRVGLINGATLLIKSDTAVTGEHSGYPALGNTGVTFAYVDRGVRNSFSYYYAVTAFDVNSLKSGPSSLESPRITKQVTPRTAGPNVTTTVLLQGVYGADGTKLDPSAPYPKIDAATGTFSGNVPPANDGALLLSSAVLEALPAGDVASVTIDSVSAGTVGGIAAPPNIYFSVKSGASVIHQVVAAPEPGFNADLTPPGTYSANAAIVPYDSGAARRFGIQFSQDVRMPVTFGASVISGGATSPGRGTIIGRYGISGGDASRYLAHSRWFDQGGTEPADPTITSRPDSTHNAGGLKGVAKIWAPQAYRNGSPPGDALFPVNAFQRGSVYGASTAWYPGDFLVTWAADSSITVFDSSNHVTLPLAANGGPGFGFVNIRAFTAAAITSGDLDDGTGTSNVNILGYHHAFGLRGTCDGYWGINCALAERKAQVEPVDFNSDGVADGQGIGLVINGEFFIMQLSAGVIPAAGTKWHLRALTGTMTATCTPGVQAVMTDCSAYTFSGGPRPSLAPGLTYKITVLTKYAVDSSVAGSLTRVHTVPDPYYVTDALEATANTKVLKFVNLPSRAIIRIYSVSGVLVQVVTHNDPTGGSEAVWNLRNRNNQFVASGVYFYHVEAPDGKTKIGRFTIVNFAP